MFGIGRKKRMLQQLQELTERLNELTKHVEEMNSSDAHRARINIEKLEVDQAFLDQLVFRLENLDIEELSGSLNLGNNFSPKVESAHEGENTSKQNTSSKKTENDSEKSSETPSSSSARTTREFVDGKELKTTDTGYLLTL